MKKIIILLLASAFSSLVVAAPINVSKSVTLNTSIEKIWRWTGGFCTIRVWHPAVEKCEVTKEGDAEFRTLTLGDGGQIKERYSGGQVYGYSYDIVESPLPVKDYSANFMAEPDGDKVKFTWSATFSAADGKTDEEAEAAIAGIFESGLSSIEERYAQREEAIGEMKERMMERREKRTGNSE